MCHARQIRTGDDTTDKVEVSIILFIEMKSNKNNTVEGQAGMGNINDYGEVIIHRT